MERAYSLLVLVLVLVLAMPALSRAVTIDTVLVGDAGNPNDPATGIHGADVDLARGSVDYAYRMGRTEVTLGQYTEFLNAVAMTGDPYQVWNPTSGIGRSGTVGNFHYVVSNPDRPVTWVGWLDAARFANWMQNGQPAGPEGPGTTETGTYTLNGVMSGSGGLANITRNPGSTWFIPNQDEWHKAAFYQPAGKGGDTDGYWRYPTRSNSLPFSDQPPGSTPDNTRVANFYNDDGKNNGYDDGYAVTGATNFNPRISYLTAVGAYTSSSSYYGTFDQAGNAMEWTEETSHFSGVDSKIARGGAWDVPGAYLAANEAAYRGINGTIDTGFRLAAIPEPSTSTLAALAFLGLLAARLRKCR